MAKFTSAEWTKVFAELDANGAAYAFPERRSGSVVFASFNIRKLGKVAKKSAGAWEFLSRFIAACDLVAIQEVQDDLSALNHLMDLTNAKSGGKFGFVVSDVTGANMPKGTGLRERLAFVFRWDRVERTAVASDITVDRSAVLDSLYVHRTEFATAFETHTAALVLNEYKHQQKMAAYKQKLRDWEAAGSMGTKPKKPTSKNPPFVLPYFVTFIRTPYCVSFRVPGKPGSMPYEFLAVDAHLLYGDKVTQVEERRNEFYALVEWLSSRAKNVTNLYHKDLILFGDCNLDFDDQDVDRADIDKVLTGLNKGRLKRTKVTVNFPFLSVHPSRASLPSEQQIFRTNAREDQTYDQIGLFIHDERLPQVPRNATAGATGKDDYDFRVFDFVNLFAHVLEGKPFDALTKAPRKALLSKFENDVTDHMPIWIRLPLPG